MANFLLVEMITENKNKNYGNKKKHKMMIFFPCFFDASTKSIYLYRTFHGNKIQQYDENEGRILEKWESWAMDWRLDFLWNSGFWGAWVLKVKSLFEISRWVNVQTEKFEFEIINGTEAVDQFFQMIASISTIFFSRTNNFAQKMVAKGRFFHCICLSFNSYSIQSHLCVPMFSVLIFAFRLLHTIFNCSFTDGAVAFGIWHTFNVTFDSIVSFACGICPTLLPKINQFNSI